MSDDWGGESAWREGEALFREFAENLDVVLWIADPRVPRAIYVSPAYERLWQRPAAALYSDIEVWADAIHPDDRERARAGFFEKSKAGKHEMEYRVVRPDGSQIWIRDRCFPVRDEHGELVRLTGIAEDITGRKTNERVLQQWADSFKCAAHGIVLGDPVTYRLIRCNPAFASMLGRTMEELEGALLPALHPPSEAPYLQACIDKADREGSVCFESVMLRADGSLLPVQVDLNSVRDAQGALLYRVGTVQDIAARKLAEQKMRTLSAHLESAMEAASIGVWVWDPRDNMLWGNDRQRRLWGLSSEVPPLFPASLVHSMVHEADQGPLAEASFRAAREGTPLVGDFRLLLPDGRIRWVATRARPESNEAGGFKLVGVNMDVTEQKLASEAISRSQKLEALGTLAGGIAHDFNNILQAVLGNAELGLARLSPDHPCHANLNEISVAAERAADLVRRILTFSKPQESKRRGISLVPILDEALRLLRATIPASIEFQLEALEPVPSVNADPSQVHQILVNLVTNAAHAIGREGGRIEIKLQRLSFARAPEGALRQVDSESVQSIPDLVPGAYAHVSIRDTGRGMDRETLARAFDPFFTTKPPGEGTGLGLSVVHGIMRALGGAVTAYSELGRGSVFHLYFPVEALVEAGEPRALPSQRGHGEVVLFVDDERAITLLAKQGLENFGYAVEAFTDPRVALEAFRGAPGRYAAVVTDLTMPGMNGFELASAVLQLRPQLPVILISGYVGPDEYKRAGAMGIRELLPKPLTIDALTGRLHTSLAASQPRA